jgi:hypothetical protein
MCAQRVQGLGERWRMRMSYYRRLLTVVFFFGGVTWDALTLRRIDALGDNLILLTYLLTLGAALVLAVLTEFGRLRAPWLLRYRAYFPAVLQFFFGALFSAYVVFYFRSTAAPTHWLFFAVLVGLLVANEFMHRRLLSLYVLLGLYTLCSFTFFVFFVPVLLRQIGDLAFGLSSVLSLLPVWLLIVLFHRQGIVRKKQYIALTWTAVAVVVGLGVLYVLNWIPPVPLALREGGVYHHVRREGSVYVLHYEAAPWYQFWQRVSPRFHYTEDDTVFCFASVFAPTQLRTGVRHVWQRYDETRRQWVTQDEMAYAVVGGRGGGYRGYTFKRQLQPGRWRVEVRTEHGRLLGRIAFELIPAPTRPPLRVRRVA